MKRVIITGASGLVATELTVQLLSKTDAIVYLLSTHIDNIQERYKEYKDRVFCFTLESFSLYAQENKDKEAFDICIHTAFSRSAKGNLIVDSINYQQELIKLLKQIGVKTFVNISSQSVYGKMSEPLWTESTPLEPDYLYAMGKYTSEVITKLMLESSNIKWTNIRLCSVCENARFIRVFVQNAINGNPIVLTASDQQCSFIEVRDVAEGLLSFIELADSVHLEQTYNLGANLENTIGDIAKRVKRIGEEKYNLPFVVIEELDSNNHIKIGMDATSFMQTFKWSPQYNMDDMITEMFEMLTNVNGGVSVKL